MSLERIAKEANVDLACIKVIAKWEGCLKRVSPGMFGPYLCPARVPTIGRGTTVWPNGRKVSMADAPITQARCDELLAFDIGKKYAPAVDRLRLPWKHGNQRSACISLAYNAGTAGFAKSTMAWLIRHKQYDRAALEFRKWIRGGGRVLPGLVNRRRDEESLYRTPGGTLPATTIAAEPSASPPPQQAPPSRAQSKGLFSRLLWWR